MVTPTIITYLGRNIEDMTRDELLAALRACVKELDATRNLNKVLAEGSRVSRGVNAVAQHDRRNGPCQSCGSYLGYDVFANTCSACGLR